MGDLSLTKEQCQEYATTRGYSFQDTVHSVKELYMGMLERTKLYVIPAKQSVCVNQGYNIVNTSHVTNYNHPYYYMNVYYYSEGTENCNFFSGNKCVKNPPSCTEIKDKFDSTVIPKLVVCMSCVPQGMEN